MSILEGSKRSSWTRGALSLQVVAILLLVGCSDGEQEGGRARREPTDRSKVTRASTTTSTTIEPVPAEIDTDMGVCAYLSAAPKAAPSVELAWARVAVPPPAAQRGPVLTAAWTSGTYNTEEDGDRRRGEQLTLALPRIVEIVKARNDVEAVLVVFTGTNYESSYKTIFGFEGSEALSKLRTVDPNDEAAVARVARSAETAETSGPLLFTWMGPDQNRIADDGLLLLGCP